MTAVLNHIIVYASDPKSSAEFLADVLDVEAKPQWGHFFPVVVANGVTLDFMHADGPFTKQHCAFVVDEATFDRAHEKMVERGVATYADPNRQRPGEINHRFGGRGVYFDDPDGHLMELMTSTPE